MRGSTRRACSFTGVSEDLLGVLFWRALCNISKGEDPDYMITFIDHG
jgi:hypothetical protein